MAHTVSVSRRRFLTGTAGVGGLVGVPGLLTACSTTGGDGDILAKLRKQGYVRIGFADEAPYGYKDGGDLLGEAPTLHQVIFKALGVGELRASVVDFASLIPSLNANRFDVVSAGMAITPERCENAAFSEPEFVSPTALLVREGNPHDLSDLKSCAGKDVMLGVLSAAVEKNYATAAGVSRDRITSLSAQQDGLDALVAGRIDAFALTGISLKWLARTNGGAPVDVLPAFVPEVDGKKQYSPGGAVFRRSDTALRDAFNEELTKITSDADRYVKLIGDYGFGESEIPPSGMTTRQLCKG
ncbi:ectoine/hydroxyectoine ABC transporter substrate-binding protein EhuB [Streptomyces soliscabiei]|uniref:ectoine/hydroxyectoine ABC transporter substrate-binding protein EhuB n=1 Tax=Streptomyces soliscabiei TaxID=588897 RepID=UPI0029BC9AE0|nr:ectoine/hydroxyectoine ABC transporter substrate-binding protein EhuB [Streptomyces sp. NY05-11A]MDX2681663.1 ectoine/hydroxyectoine ABC transporter substrate-binding protein EhuB [Streptomyces sp. NY05-11A]